jgi:hypothetical protein
VKLNDLSDADRAELVTKMRDKITAGESPSNDDVKVLVESWLIPEYGIHDTQAALLLSLNESDGSYAISLIDEYYHRVTCDEIEADDSVKITLSKRLDEEKEDRQPCPKCRPDKLDFEAQVRK